MKPENLNTTPDAPDASLQVELDAAQAQIAALRASPAPENVATNPPSDRELIIRDKVAKGLSRAQAIGVIERQEQHDSTSHVRPRGLLVTASRHGKISRTVVSRPGDARS